MSNNKKINEDGDLKQFKLFLDSLIEMKKNKEGFKLYLRHGGLQAKGDENLRLKICKERKINEKDFDKHVGEILEIGNNAILENNKKDYIEDEFKNDRNIGKKIELIESSSLIDSKLKENFLLYKTFKSNILDSFDWEIVTKKYDKKRTIPKNFNVAVIRFGLRSPCIDNIEKTDYFTFECSKYAIDNLIKNLQEIREKIKQLDSGD